MVEAKSNWGSGCKGRCGGRGELETVVIQACYRVSAKFTNRILLQSTVAVEGFMEGFGLDLEGQVGSLHQSAESDLTKDPEVGWSQPDAPGTEIPSSSR